jgi:hypothetical protein
VSTITNPTYTQKCDWALIPGNTFTSNNDTIVARYSFTFVTPGTGAFYTLSLPNVCTEPPLALGVGKLIQVSTQTVYVVEVDAQDGNDCGLIVSGVDPRVAPFFVGAVSPTYPFAVAIGDTFELTLTYRAGAAD